MTISRPFVRALLMALAAGAFALACSSSSSSSSSTASSGDAGTLRYYELVVGGSPCITEPATLDAQGLTSWRYVIAYPSGGSTTCQAGLTAVDSTTAAALTSAAHLTSSALCELPQVSTQALDGGTCVPDGKPEWCYQTSVMVGPTYCDQAALASAGSAGAPKMSRYFVLLTP